MRNINGGKKSKNSHDEDGGSVCNSDASTYQTQFSRSNNLKRHQNTCKPTGVKRKYSEEDNVRKWKATKIQSEDGEDMIQPEEEEEEERVDRSTVLSGEIDDLIDKFIHENFSGSDGIQEEIDQLKDDIWQVICEHTEFE